MKRKRGFLGEVLIVLFTVFLVMSMNSSFAAERSLKDMKPTVWRTQSITPTRGIITHKFTSVLLKRLLEGRMEN